MTFKGRFPAREVHLKNGFYIEVRDKGGKQGMKIRSENQKGMEAAAAMYGSYKDVTILGEYKGGVPSGENS